MPVTFKAFFSGVGKSLPQLAELHMYNRDWVAKQNQLSLENKHMEDRYDLDQQKFTFEKDKYEAEKPEREARIASYETQRATASIQGQESLLRQELTEGQINKDERKELLFMEFGGPRIIV